MTDYEIPGTPFALASIIHLDPGDSQKQIIHYTVPEDRLFIIEYIGINSFLQPQQELCAAIMPVFDSGLTVYPIAVQGQAPSLIDPEMPFRRFGSQQLLLYADDRVEISAVRNSTEGKAYIEFNISGRLVQRVPCLEAPSNLRTGR